MPPKAQVKPEPNVLTLHPTHPLTLLHRLPFPMVTPVLVEISLNNTALPATPPKLYKLFMKNC